MTRLKPREKDKKAHSKNTHLAKCGNCHRSLPNDKLECHKQARHNFKCVNCEEYFRTKLDFNEHLDIIHDISNTLPIQIKDNKADYFNEQLPC